jgi:hypothetical protein
MTTSGPGHRLLTAGDAINGGGVASSPRAKRSRHIWLRWIGASVLSAGIALLVVPVSREYSVLGARGRQDCGVPLQTLFRMPGDACANRAMFRVAEAAIVAGIGVVLLAFSGIRRRLRFLGIALLGASPFLMMFRTDDGWIADGHHCGSAIGDLVRRSYSEISVNGATRTLDPWCGDVALNRFFITLGVATVGVLFIGFAALRQYRAAKREGLDPLAA